MALSDFPRFGLDPFLELRRMQSEMNRLFSGFSAVATREFPQSISGSVKTAPSLLLNCRASPARMSISAFKMKS